MKKKKHTNEFQTVNPFVGYASKGAPAYTVETDDSIEVLSQKKYLKSRSSFVNAKVTEWTDPDKLKRYVRAWNIEKETGKKIDLEQSRKKHVEKHDKTKENLIKQGYNVFIYADGSLSAFDKSEAAGCAVEVDGVITHKEAFRFQEERKIEGRTNRFEHYAVITAILTAKNMGLTQFVIFTDSYFAMKDAAKRDLESPFGELYYEWIQKQSAEMEIVFRKITGHIGIEGNSIADNLAFMARTNASFEATTVDIEDVLGS